MSNELKTYNRRKFLKQLSALGAVGLLCPDVLFAKPLPVIYKKIPKSGEALPVVGLGSSNTFDIGSDKAALANIARLLKIFFDSRGSLIDSSPMYGSSEQVIGDALGQLKKKPKLFSATKVWTDGKQAGITQMQQSMQRMGVDKFDLMQIHNLRDWKTHLKTLKEWKEKGKIRYLGITTSHGRFHARLEELLKKESFDFVQLSYNILDREVEKKLLPLAAERGVAVLVNRPYQRGNLFKKTRGKNLPEWSKEFDCNSWGQFFLKFILSHPAVTCVIPATSKAKHMLDNMGAGYGRLPDAKTRERMIKTFAAL